MNAYLISTRTFFMNANGIDTAMAVDIDNDFKLFTTKQKAVSFLNGVVVEHKEHYNCEVEEFSYGKNHFGYICKRENRTRTVFEFIKKEMI